MAQNHSAMTHLPVASALLATLSALVGLFSDRRGIARSWAPLSIVALVTVFPALLTGVMAAKGRFNGEGKPFIQNGVLVADAEANSRIWKHEVLGVTGAAAAATLTALGIGLLRGRTPNKYVIVLLAITMAVTWSIGAHLGGEELWGPDTFPAFK